jgi:hypothetical protein
MSYCSQEAVTGEGYHFYYLVTGYGPFEDGLLLESESLMTDVA